MVEHLSDTQVIVVRFHILQFSLNRKRDSVRESMKLLPIDGKLIWKLKKLSQFGRLAEMAKALGCNPTVCIGIGGSNPSSPTDCP